MLRLIQWNCDGFYPRLEYLQKLISDCSPNFICLQETNFTKAHHPYLKNYTSYNFLRPTHLRWKTLDSLYDSNHYPILISSHITETAEVKTKWKITGANWSLFSDTVEDLSNQVIFRENIDDAVEQFKNCILTEADQCIGKYTINSSRKTVPWWNDSCKLAIKEYKKALNRYRKTRSTEDLIYFKKMRARSKRVLKESKKESWKKFVNSITSDTPPAQMWTKIKQMRGLNTYRKIPAITDGDNIITNDNQITETLAKYFQNKTKSELSVPYPTNHLPPIPIQTNPINLAFTEEELNLTISSMKNSSAGPDEIPSIFLKHLHTATISKLLALFNKI
ncbi:uncharacterized protein LOC126882650 [Diabrotica virgifera virgifera]|uniref:Endonuclease/exonuclease/phosphatase domain-containing protein n=1 Tax=Diabrotica virgifera virgifera TaxID=50390 RepID=A0ABM5K067_DIAVI|nr:uncharacterized protein LOC126882650 [Diabrotica virgifera virgifera]